MKIAIVKLSAMGDIIHAMVALEFIKKRYPHIQIDWIVEEVFAPILQDNPNIDNIIPINLKKVKKQKSLLFSQIKKVLSLRKNSYDLVIDAQGLIKSAIVSRLIHKRVAGFDKDSIREGIASIFYTQSTNIGYDKNSIDRNAKVLSNPLDFEITKDNILAKQPFIYYHKSKIVDDIVSNLDSKKMVIFIIGSTWKSRNYPKEKFVQLANTIQENILIPWGNQDELDDAKYIESNSKYVTTMPKLDLNALKYLISKSNLLIGNDTGPTHLAWGLNIASVTIFGPTPVFRTYQTPINKTIKSLSKIDPYKLNKNDFSIQEIEVDAIFDIAKDLL
jgi:heptosyltransferase-1